MEGALQHHVAEGQSLSFDLLRNDLYKLLDKTGVKKISQIYVRAMLYSSLRMTC